MDLIERLTREIEKRGISKLELSRLSGVKKSTVYNLFNGAFEAKTDTLLPIAKVLGVSLDYLITGEDSLPAPYILQIYNELTDTGKELLLAYAKGVYASEKGELPKK